MSAAAVGAIGPVGGGAVYALSPYLDGVVRASDAVVATQAAAIAVPAPPSPADTVLRGDGGLLVQSYGAVALSEQPLALAPLYTQPVVPAIPPVAPVTRIGRTGLPVD
jgi:hypothetical protein